MSQPNVHLRPETNADIPFLRTLYATTRVDVTFSGLPEEQKRQFLEMQFNAQHHHYRTQYENTTFSIIEVNRHPAGRLYTSRMTDQIRVVDISLTPQYRRQGIGAGLLRSIQLEAQSLGLPVTLHAEKMGSVVDFYKQLDFEVLDETTTHFFMKWVAGASVIVS
jgi:GNAT superfamily N-acetyltransferase